MKSMMDFDGGYRAVVSHNEETGFAAGIMAAAMLLYFVINANRLRKAPIRRR